MAFQDWFSSVPVLRTPQLVLRPFCYSDMEAYLGFFTSSAVQQYLGGLKWPRNEREQRQWVDNINGRCLKNKLVFTWCVEEAASGAVVGRIDLGGFVRRSMADLAYYFAPELWGQGLATEAAAAVVRFGLEELGLHRIQATVRPENPASVRVLEKSGFQREGLLRQYDFGYEFHDVYLYALLQTDEEKGNE